MKSTHMKSLNINLTLLIVILLWVLFTPLNCFKQVALLQYIIFFVVYVSTLLSIRKNDYPLKAMLMTMAIFIFFVLTILFGTS